MKKGKKTSKTSMLLFLLGILLFFLVIGSLKEGVTSEAPNICPVGFKLSLNDPTICCKGNYGYVSQNDKTKCCKSDTIINEKNRKCVSTDTISSVLGLFHKPVDASSIILSAPIPTEPTDIQQTFNTIDTNKDNLLSKDEVYTWGYNKYGPSITREFSDSRFNERDINPKDGYLSLNEFK